MKILQSILHHFFKPKCQLCRRSAKETRLYRFHYEEHYQCEILCHICVGCHTRLHQLGKAKPMKPVNLTIREDQYTWVKKNHLNLSAFLQEKLDQLIKKRGGISKWVKKIFGSGTDLFATQATVRSTTE